MFSALAFHLRQKLFLDGFQLARIEGCNLADTKRNIAHDEFFEILVENLLRRFILQIASCAEHFGCKLRNADACNVRQSLCCRFIKKRTRRRPEHQRIGNDGCAEQSCDVRRDLQLFFLINFIHNRSRAAHRLIAEHNRRHRLK